MSSQVRLLPSKRSSGLRFLDAAAEKHIIPALESGRPLIMLEDRYVRIYDGLHEQFLLQWKYLVNVDKEAHSITIRSSNPAGGVHLDSVYAAMQGFGEYEERMKALAAELKEVIFEPRFKLRGGQLPLYEFDEVSIMKLRMFRTMLIISI